MTENDLPTAGMSDTGRANLQQILDHSDDGANLILQALGQTRMAMCVTDPRQGDNPIIFANPSFYEMTRYDESDVVGNNCRMLQGEGTDPSHIAKMRDLIRNEKTGVVELLNYRKDGTSFWNAVHIGPIYDREGRLVYFYGTQWDVNNVVAARVADQQFRMINRELNHRMKNVFAVIASIVTMSSRGMDSAQDAADIARDRIVALGRAHEATIGMSMDDSGIQLRDMVAEVLSPFHRATSSDAHIEGKPIELPRDAITPMGLVLHELATNSAKHGFLGNRAQELTIRWELSRDESGMLDFLWEERFEDPGTVDSVHEGSGTQIIRTVLAAVHASFERKLEENYWRSRIRLPMTNPVQIKPFEI
ncbi:PAS domain-containing protein [Novosphingopyxis iocasae]|uniref:PAS domain-containing protein n=1 Tax=Novosphingopyxis iocasae TaxID=2762729 RepID=UPI001650DD54|nr:PAS domain-containing protein [Novosphingopyxis iocasae]